jgi:hypothetical protein
LQTEPQGSQASTLEAKEKRMPLEEANTEKLLSSADSGDLLAAPMNGPTCSSDVIVLDWSDDYVDIDDWNWGRTTSFEVHIKYDSFNDYSSIFDFGDGGGIDNVILGNSELRPQ